MIWQGKAYITEIDLEYFVELSYSNIGCVALPDANSEKKFYTNSAKIFLLKIA